MAFELKIKTDGITSDGKNILVSDDSIWGVDEIRANFGVFLKGQFYASAEPDDVSLGPANVLTVVQWTALSPANGRYKFTAYAFPTIATAAVATGNVAVDTDGTLKMYDGATWQATTLDIAIAGSKQSYTSAVLNTPLLSYAYIYRNSLNLAYIAQVKSDIAYGADQNKLYYKRTNLDYFYALILAAEYNWALSLYENFYQVVENLNAIINTGKLS